MGALLLFLLIACLLSLLVLSSQSAALWTRMPLAILLLMIYFLNTGGLGVVASTAIGVVGLLLALAILHWGSCSIVKVKFYSAPLLIALLVAVYVGLRPSLLEYPVDHVNYWQRLLEASGYLSQDVLACDMGGVASYPPYCTLWFKLAASSPMSLSWLASGGFARLVHCGELLLLALTLIRVWASQCLRPTSMACMLVLVFAGTGYLYDAFVINHALQGSILAAAVLVESAGAFCWLLGRINECRNFAIAISLLIGWYAIASLYILLVIKLHGLFALLGLLWLLVMPVLLALLPGSVWSPVGYLRGYLALISLVATTSIFLFKDAIHLVIPPNFAGVVIRWTDRLGIHGFGDWGPASFLPRTSDTRPEALAVVSLIVAIAAFLVLTRSGWSKQLNSSSRFLGQSHGVASEQQRDYLVISSAYALSVLIAYLIPPFSNLFLKLNPEYSSHMRLMWGTCLVSPLPFFLFMPSRLLSRTIVSVSVGVMVVILLPIQLFAGPRAQVFFSKTRHFVIPTPPWADPSHVASLIVPQLRHIAGSDSRLRGMRVVADPIIRSSLYPFAVTGDPPIGLGADRLFQVSQLPPRASLLAEAQEQADPLPRHTYDLPELVIQQDVRECFYSVYSDMHAYSPCVAARVTDLDVNLWSPESMRKRGYVLKWQSAVHGYKIWGLPGI